LTSDESLTIRRSSRWTCCLWVTKETLFKM